LRALVTGGTGFFGRSLLRFWLEEERPPEEVCIITREPERFLAQNPEFGGHPWLWFHRGDVLKTGSLPTLARFTHLIHAATESTNGPNHAPLDQYTKIVDGTRNMLDYAVSKGICRFLLTSSGGVYGRQPRNIEEINEEYDGAPDTLDTKNAYSVAKRSAEHLCALYRERHGLETVIARCFAFIGRDLPRNAHFAAGNFIRDALYSNEIHVHGDGTAVRTYLDQRDLAKWLTRLLERGNAGEAYNVGSDIAITIEDLATKVRNLLSPQKSIRIAVAPQKQNDRNIYVPSIAKARDQLGLSIRYDLEQAIKAAATHG
jgi:UDP-glucuronate decarboxylase